MNIIDKIILKLKPTHVSQDLAIPDEVVFYKMYRGRPHIIGTMSEEEYYDNMEFETVYHIAEEKQTTTKEKESV